MKIKFTKMQAYGNDYVYIDAINQDLNNLNELSKAVSDRHFGVGSDGMVLIAPSEVADFRMRIFNPDGTEAEMCGNALRSSAKFVYYHGMTDKTKLTFETFGGIKNIELEVTDGQVTNIHAEIGVPIFSSQAIPVKTDSDMFIDKEVQVLDKTFSMSSLSWGNPHTVIFVDDVLNFDVEKYGPAIENHEIFPKRTNVTFAQVVSNDYILIREWERGTGETIGCGTGCCSATIFAHLLKGTDRKATVKQIGGELSIEWDDEDKIHMIGPSHVVFEGEYEWN